jgi:hypothetical protein
MNDLPTLQTVRLKGRGSDSAASALAELLAAGRAL